MKGSSIWYLVPPVATTLFLWPATSALIQGAWQHRRIEGPVVLLLAPVALAILAAPGFVYAVFARGRWSVLRLAGHAWIGASLALAILAAVGAAIVSIPTGLGPVLSLWTLVASVRLALVIRKESEL